MSVSFALCRCLRTALGRYRSPFGATFSPTLPQSAFVSHSQLHRLFASTSVRNAAGKKKDYSDDIEDADAEGLEHDVRPMKKGKKGKTKDPNEPKRPKTAFFLWLEANRARIKASLPADARVTDVVKQAGAQWRQLESSQKKTYQEKAEEAKKAYHQAKADYLRKKAS